MNLNLFNKYYCTIFYIAIFSLFIINTTTLNATLTTNYTKTTFSGNTNLRATNIEFDIKNQIMTATGNATITHGKKILIADKIIYNSQNKMAVAQGNVEYIDDDGNKIFATKLILDSQITTGILKQFTILLTNYTVLQSKEAFRNYKSMYFFKKAQFYNQLPTEPDKKPSAVLHAKSGKFDSINQTLQLNNTWLTLYGIPVGWSPIVSFNNLKMERRIGFLNPMLKHFSYLGWDLITPFYIPIEKTQSLTLKLHTFFQDQDSSMESNNLVQANYDGYLPKTQFSINTAYLNQDYQKEKFWSIFANDILDLSDSVRVTTNIEKSSNISTLNTYDINPKSTSESYFDSYLNTEIFPNYNNYISFNYHDYSYINSIFINQNNYHKNYTLNYNYFGEESKIGRFNINSQANTFFNDDNSSLIRISNNISNEYQIQKVLGLFSINSILQSSLYKQVQGNNSSTNNQNKNNYLAGAASLTWEYPLLSIINDSFITITPTIQTSISDYIAGKYVDSIVDSFNTNISINNLFDINHYSGYDQFEISRNIKYGIAAEHHSSSGLTNSVFIGQIADLKNYTKLNSSNVSLSNYYFSVNFNPITSIHATYSGIISNERSIIEDNMSLGYYSSLFLINTKFSRYYELDPSIYPYRYMKEIQSNAAVKINTHLLMGITTTHISNTQTPTSLQYLTYNLNWVDDNMNFIIFVKKNMYTNNNNDLSYGAQITLLNIKVI